MKPSLFTTLEREWVDFAAHPASTAALHDWAIDDPLLVRFADLDSLVRFLHTAGSSAEADALLAVLARRAGTEFVAARTLLQSVLYGLVSVSARFRTTDDDADDVHAAVIAAAWERIRTYPFDRRPRSIGANIVLDSQQSVSRTLFRARVSEAPIADIDELDAQPSRLTGSDELLGLLCDAVRRKCVCPDDAALIAATRIFDVPVTEIAAGSGRPCQTVRKRRHRAETALAAALR